MENKKLKDIINEYINNGRKDEYFVARLLEECCGGTCEESTTDEDKYKHIDIWWNSPKAGRMGIDVKGLKKNKRNDSEVDDTIHWVEIQGVTGHKGWIYGEMDYIAFMTKTKVLFVRPKDLYGIILFKIAGKQLLSVCPNECYQPYRRFNRNDIILKVPTLDIEGIAHFKLDYSLNQEI